MKKEHKIKTEETVDNARVLQNKTASSTASVFPQINNESSHPANLETHTPTRSGDNSSSLSSLSADPAGRAPISLAHNDKPHSKPQPATLAAERQQTAIGFMQPLHISRTDLDVGRDSAIHMGTDAFLRRAHLPDSQVVNYRIPHALQTEQNLQRKTNPDLAYLADARTGLWQAQASSHTEDDIAYYHTFPSAPASSSYATSTSSNTSSCTTEARSSALMKQSSLRQYENLHISTTSPLNGCGFGELRIKSLDSYSVVDIEGRYRDLMEFLEQGLQAQSSYIAESIVTPPQAQHVSVPE
jgi:hypothetical protein